MIFASFDLDSTLVNSSELIDLALTEMGYELALKTGFDYKFIEGREPPPDFQWDVFFYRLFTERFCELKPVDEHVFEFLKLVYGKREEPLKIISSRPSGVLIHHCSMELLKKNFPGIDFSVDIIGTSSEKHRYLFGSDIMFEDRRKTAIELSVRGIIVFLINTEYNKMPDGVKTIDIKDLNLRNIEAGNIVTFDDYSELIKAGVSSFISPF